MNIFEFLSLIYLKPHIKIARSNKIGVGAECLFVPQETSVYKGGCLGCNLHVADNVIHFGISLAFPIA